MRGAVVGEERLGAGLHDARESYPSTMLSPPDQLRRAASLLENAKAATTEGERDAALAEVVDICERTIGQIRELYDPIMAAARQRRI